jgi:hypothetical protein
LNKININLRYISIIFTQNQLEIKLILKKRSNHMKITFVNEITP